LRANFTFVHDSRGPLRASVTPAFPRAILFTADARLVLSFTGDPGAPGFDLLEALAFDDASASFSPRAWLLPAAQRRAWRPPPEAMDCARCHGADARPIFDSYPLWPGFYGAVLDAFPRDRPGREELARYRAFLAGAARAAPYNGLAFPAGSSTSPYLDPRRMVEGAVELDPSTMPFLPNTRLGMALTELNRARIGRKLAASPGFPDSGRPALAGLLGCSRAAAPAPAAVETILGELARENDDRLRRLGLRADEPRPAIDAMEELRFAPALAEIDAAARRLGADRTDWSMALEPGALAFFDGILSGMYGDRSYYLKEDVIYALLERLSARDPALRRWFAADWVFGELGYPFGDRLDIGRALGACPALRKG